MRCYVFLSEIVGSGGVQCYVAAKTAALERTGWSVFVFGDHFVSDTTTIHILSLQKYLPQGIPLLSMHPCAIPKFLVKVVLNKIVKKIYKEGDYEEIIIESWNSQTAQWGELLAEKTKGKHFFWTANESYRGADKMYESKIDFYRFKLDRREIFSSPAVLERLFAGCREVNTENFVSVKISEDPIQDVVYPKVEALRRADWNICYIGRTNKPYVPNVVKGVIEFACSQLDKKIQFIIVGESSPIKPMLDSISQENLLIAEMGDLYPLPQNLYEKIDVVIAGAGSARHSVDAGALVISTDSELCCSHGILGYDTNYHTYVTDKKDDSVIQMSFFEALNRALITKEWMNSPFKWKRTPNAEECLKNQFEIISMSSIEKKYYDERELLKGRKDYLRVLRVLCRMLIN